MQHRGRDARFTLVQGEHMASIHSPAEVDALLHDLSADLHCWLSQQQDGPLRQVRALQVAITLGDVSEMRRCMTDLPDIAPARGLQLLALAQLGDYDGVLNYEPCTPGSSLLELENLVHGYTAIGIACAERGQYDEAAGNTRTAAAFAVALGMHQRAQMLDLEMQRVLTMSGHASPEATAARLLEPMPLLRRKWGQRNLAESHMALGSYRAALRALGAPSDDGPADAALREYILMALHLPPARLDDDPLLSEGLPYFRLVQGSRRSSGKALNLDEIHVEPQRTYAKLMKATALAHTPKMLQQAVVLLECLTTAQADQQFYMLLLLLKCHAQGATVSQPCTLIDRIHKVLDRLHPDADSARVMFGFLPDVMTLLHLSPKPHPKILSVDLLSVPLLAGKVIRYRGIEHQMPGQSGTREVLAVLGVPTLKETRVEAKRYKTARADLPSHVVNLGWVANGCVRMAWAGRSNGLPSIAAAWRLAHDRVMDLMTEDVKVTLKANQAPARA